MQANNYDFIFLAWNKVDHHPSKDARSLFFSGRFLHPRYKKHQEMLANTMAPCDKENKKHKGRLDLQSSLFLGVVVAYFTRAIVTNQTKWKKG